MQWFHYLVVLSVITLGGCATAPPAQDYSAFEQAKPHSILVLPPVNNTPEIIAPYSVMAQIGTPIAEAGYYVFPVALVDQTFKSNGLSVAKDIQSLPVDKLRAIFGADAALYLTITSYGTSYIVLSSETRVTLTARLVDLRTGSLLWQNTATASSAESQQNVGGGLVGMLVSAAVNQIAETVSDRGFDIAALATHRLVAVDGRNGLLYGPRSPHYGQPDKDKK